MRQNQNITLAKKILILLTMKMLIKLKSEVIVIDVKLEKY